MNLHRKDLALSCTVLKSNRKAGIVTAIANTGANVDRQGDNVLPGAWVKVVTDMVSGRQQPLFLWNHNIKDLDVRGKVIRLEELPPGDHRVPMNQMDQQNGANVSALLADIQCAMGTQAGRDAFELLDGGFVKELSVQFANDPKDEYRDRKGVRNIKLVDRLFEISAVLAGASYGTAVLATKGTARRSAVDRELVESIADTVEYVVTEQLLLKEDRAYWQERKEAAVAAGSRVAMRTVVDGLAASAKRRELEASIQKAAGFEVWSAPQRRTPRPLTEREKFEREIMFKAGIQVG